MAPSVASDTPPVAATSSGNCSGHHWPTHAAQPAPTRLASTVAINNSQRHRADRLRASASSRASGKANS